MDAVVDLQDLKSGLFAQDRFESVSQICSFKEPEVHALHAGGASLMGCIARQPTAAFAETYRQSTLKLDVGNPIHFPDTLSREPRCALRQKVAQDVHSVQFSARSDAHKAIALLWWKFDAGFGRSNLKTPAASILRQRPQDAEGRLAKDQLHYVVYRFARFNFIDREKLGCADLDRADI